MFKEYNQCVAEERALLINELFAILYWVEDRENKDLAGNNLGRIWRELSDLKESQHKNQALSI